MIPDCDNWEIRRTGHMIEDIIMGIGLFRGFEPRVEYRFPFQNHKNCRCDLVLLKDNKIEYTFELEHDGKNAKQITKNLNKCLSLNPQKHFHICFNNLAFKILSQKLRDDNNFILFGPHTKTVQFTKYMLEAM